jgi:putative hydrolase of the HAD superfamily
MGEIKHVIFDLGGVIYDIDYHKTIDAFTRLGIPHAEALYSQAKQTDLFDKYEIGAITSEDFVRELKAMLNKDLNDSDIVRAWNALLIGLPKHRLDFLLEVKSQYTTYLLSNTNELHIHQINKELNDMNVEGLHLFFDEVFLSYELGMRKPHKETFEAVVTRLGLNPAETLFIDDSPQHLIGAAATGLRTYHHREGDIVDVFSEII